MSRPIAKKRTTQKNKTRKQNSGPRSLWRHFYGGAASAIVAHVGAWLLLGSIDKLMASLVNLAGHTTTLLGIQALELLHR